MSLHLVVYLIIANNIIELQIWIILLYCSAYFIKQ